jgi:hypothetical protein
MQEALCYLSRHCLPRNCTWSVRDRCRVWQPGYGSCVLPCPPTPLRKESLKIRSPWSERSLGPKLPGPRSSLAPEAPWPPKLPGPKCPGLKCPGLKCPCPKLWFLLRACRPLSLLILPLIHSQRIASVVRRSPAGSPDLTMTGLLVLPVKVVPSGQVVLAVRWFLRSGGSCGQVAVARLPLH